MERVMLTSTLKNFVDEHRNNAPVMDQVGTSISKAIEYINKMPRGAARVRKIYENIDQALAEGYKEIAKEGIKIPCVRGCAHCCHLHVMCGSEEGDYLYELAKERKILLSKKKLAYQARFKRPSDYFAKFGKRTKCVFLNDKSECMIYQHRPIACRKYFVISPPELCTPDAHGNSVNVAIVTTKVLIAAEALASAFLNIDLMEGGSKETDNFSLPARLLKRLENEV